MNAILPGRLSFSAQPQPGLVNQCRWLPRQDDHWGGNATTKGSVRYDASWLESGQIPENGAPVRKTGGQQCILVEEPQI
jgi:hypothetical protein